jgi:F-type H+-transporting ATPase subunit a
MFSGLFVSIAWLLTVLNLAGMVEIVSISSTYTLVLFLALLVLVSLGLVSAYHTGTRSLMVFVMTSQVIIGMIAFGILEVTSHLFRTISLSFRLFANILAGHLILHLVFGLCIYTIYVSAIGTTFSVLLLLALVGLECVMALIQVYVFTMLSTVYAQEL